MNASNGSMPRPPVQPPPLAMPFQTAPASGPSTRR